MQNTPIRAGYIAPAPIQPVIPPIQHFVHHHIKYLPVTQIVCSIAILFFIGISYLRTRSQLEKIRNVMKDINPNSDRFRQIDPFSSDQVIKANEEFNRKISILQDSTNDILPRLQDQLAKIKHQMDENEKFL